MSTTNSSSNVAIVAIPSENDYVNRISSEKVPHLTLLFLGELSNVKNFNGILDFAKFAADQSLMKFDLEVDHRGVLGPNLADVLFFSQSKWSGFDAINNYRSNLLKNNDIRAAYESIEQYPEWIPHLTLGFPVTPAKPDTRDYPGISYVSFDRIAVWSGDYEGVEFPLESYDWEMAMAMGNITSRKFVENFLAHNTNTYDPVKAHEYYIKTRQLKGRRKASSVIAPGKPRTQQSPTYTVTTTSGAKIVLTQQQLAEQQAYAAKRVTSIMKRLTELHDKLKSAMANAHAARHRRAPTAADKAQSARDSKLYRRSHRQTLANKAKATRTSQTVSKKDPVTELEDKINQVKERLTAALDTQRTLTSALRNN